MLKRLTVIIATGFLLAGCAGRSDHQTFFLAEQGDYDGALQAARAAQGSGITSILFGAGESQCRDYASVVTVLVAKEDFAGARKACGDYDKECAVVPDLGLCFSYRTSELSAADTDSAIAQTLTGEAQEALHFRWLMIRDDYEGRELKRPIY